MGIFGFILWTLRWVWFEMWPVGYPAIIGIASFLSGLEVFYAAKVIAYLSFIGSMCVVYRWWGGKERPMMAVWPPFYVPLLWASYSEQVYHLLFLITLYAGYMCFEVKDGLSFFRWGGV
ncbi:MAG: hypothetical protein ACUVRD_02590 [Bacteroidia bacterium]